MLDAPWSNATAYLVDRHVEDGRGDRTAVRCGPEQVTYRELQEGSRRFAAALAALSVRSGDRVALVCADRTEMLTAVLGAWRAGAVAVPLSTMLTSAELNVLLVDSAARVLVVCPDLAQSAGAAVLGARELEHVVTIGGAAPELPAGVGRLTWEEAMTATAAVTGVVPTGPDTPALWLYTSGTTGSPKAAMHRHANVQAVCEGYGAHVLDLRPDDVCFSVAKLFFAYGLGNSALFPLAAGATTVLEPRRPTPEVVAEVMAEHAPTVFFGVPTSYSAILAADLPATTMGSVRLAVSAGEALPAALGRRVSEHLGVEVLDGLGSTEALHVFVSNRPGRVRHGSSGTAVPGYELRILDERGAPVPDGDLGALSVRGESVATGYWCRADATRAAFQGAWLVTGDVYRRSPDGFYTWQGRSDDMIKAGGIWVSPVEVEDRLREHASVGEAAVVALPDADGLDKPVAFVVAAPGHAIDADTLVDWCRAGLAAFKRPRAVVVVDELPRTPTGKVQRYRLREHARETVGAPAR